MSWVKFYGFTLNGHRYADGVGLNCGCPQRYVPLISSYVSSVTIMWRVLFKENNGNTKITLGIWSKLTVKTSERRHWRLSGLFNLLWMQFTHSSDCEVLITKYRLAYDGIIEGIIELKSFYSHTLFLYPLKTSENLLSGGIEMKHWAKMG